MAKNVSKASDNSAYVTILCFLKGWRNTSRDELVGFLSSAVEQLFKDPNDFRTHLGNEEMFSALHPKAFHGLNGIFFTYFIQRLPMMLCCTRMTWHTPKSPTRKEVDEICEECIRVFTKLHHEFDSTELIQKWREQYRRGHSYTHFWVSRENRDAYYYNPQIIEGFLEKAMPKTAIFGRLAEHNLPDSIGDAIESEASQMVITRRAWRDCFYLFIDRLSASLDFAYPIYTSSVFEEKNE